MPGACAAWPQSGCAFFRRKRKMISLWQASRSSPSPAIRRLRRTIAALVTMTLASCDSGHKGLEGTLYISIGLADNQSLNEEIIASKRKRANISLQAFQREHPEVSFQLQFYPEGELSEEMKVRDRSGQGPDLFLINAETARTLRRSGLTRPFEPKAQTIDEIQPAALQPLQEGTNAYTALPFVFEPQLACFNKTQIKQSPTTLDDLLKVSDTTLGIGLPLDVSALYWTLGSLGAQESYAKIVRSQRVDAAAREQLLHWLRWLQRANTHAGMYFYMDTQRMMDDFASGKLAWIACRSPFVGKFEKELGKDFGVALLPRGRGGRASPLSDMRVWALGTNSSANQEHIATALASFSLNPLAQFRISLNSDELIPVNRKVVIPVNRSNFLRTMERSHLDSPAMSADLLTYLGDVELQEQSDKTMVGLLYGDLQPEQALEKLLKLADPQRKQSH